MSAGRQVNYFLMQPEFLKLAPTTIPIVCGDRRPISRESCNGKQSPIKPPKMKGGPTAESVFTCRIKGSISSFMQAGYNVSPLATSVLSACTSKTSFYLQDPI